MINQEMYDLLIRSMNDQLTVEEDKQLQQALKGSSELREEKIKLNKVGELLSSRNYSFSDGFRNRVMQAVSDEKKDKVISIDFTRNFTSMFNRIAVAGVAVIVLLVISLYISHGSLNVNTFTGVDPISEDNLISVLLYEK
ncbi:MAG: hypothetical protein KAT38_00255 [Bacteroidales bacterium]|nr:hypothetical protein [Bacteroidales bacterium]